MIDAAVAREASEDETGAERGRTILVDGFNVLHALLSNDERRDGWWKRAERERLLERATSWPERADQVWVAFDGSDPSWSVWTEPVARPVSPADGERLPVHSVFVESADDWIVRRARRAADPERVVVVTRDRQVAGRARSAGCEVQPPWTFLARCGAGDPDSVRLARD